MGNFTHGFYISYYFSLLFTFVLFPIFNVVDRTKQERPLACLGRYVKCSISREGLFRRALPCYEGTYLPGFDANRGRPYPGELFKSGACFVAWDNKATNKTKTYLWYGPFGRAPGPWTIEIANHGRGHTAPCRKETRGRIGYRFSHLRVTSVPEDMLQNFHDLEERRGHGERLPRGGSPVSFSWWVDVLR